jgi:hypothetical protein
MKLNKLLCGLTLVGAVTIASAAAPAYADTIDYTLTDGSNVITFALPSTPTLAATSTDYFAVATSVTIDDAAPTAEDITFYDTTYGGGLSIATTPETDQVLDQLGPLLYSGTTSDPTLLAASNVSLTPTSIDGGADTYSGSFTLNAVDVTKTPEPASLSLTMAGIAMLGLMMVMRKRSARGLTQAS